MATVIAVIAIVLVATGLLSALAPGPTAGFFMMAGHIVFAWSAVKPVTVDFIAESLVYASLWSVLIQFTHSRHAERSILSLQGYLASFAGGLVGPLVLGPAGIGTGPVVGALVGELTCPDLLERVEQAGGKQFFKTWLVVLLRWSLLSLMVAHGLGYWGWL